MRRIVLMLSALALAGCGLDPTGSSPPVEPHTASSAASQKPTAKAEPTTTPTPSSTSRAAARAGQGERSGWSQVVDIVDGDTIKVSAGGAIETVRLIGLDTPETRHPDKPVQCFGPEATTHARDLLEGEQVRLETDATQGRLDRYGRTLAYLWLRDGRLINETMISDGYGREYTYDKPYRYQSRLQAAERAARKSMTGLWKACQASPKPPAPKPAAPEPAPPKPVPAQSVDKRYDTCAEANDAGLGPYVRGQDPEYDWYRDADSDGIVCET
ncbi:thermonuclease family protein [Actinopolymorpha sp. B11F2]|uniref:thermonuclease family protein n=1 Tax=Actinopolymorpha sp. B11F2 TaxID=3160862 RepID=UPI0032E3A01E